MLAGAPQGSLLGTLLLLIFINDIPANIEYNMKIVADDGSLFSLARDQNGNTGKLDRDLQRVSGLIYQCKM